MRSDEALKRDLLRCIHEWHADVPHDEDDERFKALVVKCVAMLVLAFGEREEREVAAVKLEWANRVLLDGEEEEEVRGGLRLS